MSDLTMTPDSTNGSSPPADVHAVPGRRRPRSGTVLALVFAVAALAMFVGYFLTPDPRCALGVADEVRYEEATVDGDVRWNAWPPGWTTVCKAFDAEGNEIPYVPAKQ